MIGVNTGNTFTYEVTAAFEPSLPYNDIEIPGTDEIFPAISFGEIQCADISTTKNALNALGEVDAALNNLIDSQANIAAVQSRYQFTLGFRAKHISGRLSGLDKLSGSPRASSEQHVRLRQKVFWRSRQR